MEPQTPVGVVVDEDDERLEIVCRESGFLSQLTPCRRFGLLAVLDLPARELPRAAEVPVVCAARDEDLAVADDDRERDLRGQAGYS